MMCRQAWRSCQHSRLPPSPSRPSFVPSLPFDLPPCLPAYKYPPSHHPFRRPSLPPSLPSFSLSLSPSPRPPALLSNSLSTLLLPATASKTLPLLLPCHHPSPSSLETLFLPKPSPPTRFYSLKALFFSPWTLVRFGYCGGASFLPSAIFSDYTRRALFDHRSMLIILCHKLANPLEQLVVDDCWIINYGFCWIDSVRRIWL